MNIELMERLISRVVELEERIGELERGEDPSGVDPAGHLHAKLVASDGDPDPALSVDAAGDLTAVGNVTIGVNNFAGNSYTIADDDFGSFTPGNSIGVMIIYGRNSSYDEIVGIITFRTVATVFTTSIVKSADLELTTGALNGTTGTDGRTTVSTHTDGKIYIENREGGSRSYGVVLLGN